MIISFKLFGPEAAEILSELHRLSFPADGEQIWSTGEIKSLFQGPDTYALMVLDREQPAGFLMWRQVADEAEILTICILPAYRCKGLAGQLMQNFYGKIRDKDVKTVFLEVNENNRAALVLYGKNGFETVGRRQNYYGGKGAKKQHALMMKYSG